MNQTESGSSSKLTPVDQGDRAAHVERKQRNNKTFSCLFSFFTLTDHQTDFNVINNDLVYREEALQTHLCEEVTPP